MAHTYQGPATVITEGASVSVEADLRVEFGVRERAEGGWIVRERGLKSWLGSVQAVDGEGIWELSNAAHRKARLRLPDGREAEFYSDGASSDMDHLTITGVGPAPFWDADDEG